MHRHQDATCRAIEDSVSCAATEFNFLDELVCLCIDHGVRVAVFVGHKYPLWARSIRQAIGIIDGSNPCDRTKRLRIYRRYLVITGRRGKDPLQLGHGPYSMDPREARKVSHYFSCRCINDHDPVGIHVRDIQAASGRIQALVIKANCRAGQWNVRDGLQRPIVGV